MMALLSINCRDASWVLVLSINSRDASLYLQTLQHLNKQESKECEAKS